MQKRCQVSAEALFSLGIITLLFAAMFVYSLERREDVRVADERTDRQGECFTLANVIVGLLQNPGGAANVTLLRNATINAAARVIVSEDEPCRIPTAAVTDGTFGPGRVLLASDLEGNVTVQDE